MKEIRIVRKKKEPKKDHTCTRFKTVKKANGVRKVVACRVCGAERVLVA